MHEERREEHENLLPPQFTPKRRNPVLPLVCFLLLAVCAGGGIYWWQQRQAEIARQNELAALRNRIKEVVLADNALALEILEMGESSHITYGEFFKRTEKNKEERDALVRKLRAIEAGPYTQEVQNFVKLMEMESEYVRAEEAVSRQSMEVSSRAEILKAAFDSSQSALNAVDSAESRFMAAPYGMDWSEKFDLELARSRAEHSVVEADTLGKSYDKSVADMKTKMSSANLAADDWLKSEDKLYPSFVPQRDIISLLVKRKAKYKNEISGSGNNQSVKAGEKEAATKKSTPATGTAKAIEASVKISEPEPTSTPRPAVPNRQRSDDPLAGERFPETRLRELGYHEVAQMSDDDIRYAINEMYARFGMTFKNKSLQSNFEGYKWYRPDDRWKPTQIERQFNRTEKSNHKLLIQVRDERRYE